MYNKYEHACTINMQHTVMLPVCSLFIRGHLHLNVQWVVLLGAHDMLSVLGLVYLCCSLDDMLPVFVYNKKS
jgi:hypothetical protein